jgi:hypothetical protein
LQAIVKNAFGGRRLGVSRRARSIAGYGALAPPLSRWKPNAPVLWPPPPPPPPIAVAAAAAAQQLPQQPVDVRACLPWPVRDQGNRGTCVAFGTTALREQLACEQGAGSVDLSEQFLYCDIKTNSSDPYKTTDGTWIEFAFESLDKEGISLETSWPYNPVLNPGNISQGAPGLPTAAATTEALTYAVKAATYQRSTVSTGSAQSIFNLLQSKNRPVAISVPVFSDPSNMQTNNWETNIGFYYGFVLDPPPGSVVNGGHCVCVTGFAPDPAEPLGGYFVIRNSWNTQWGSQLPAPGYFGPEAGYGQISASYVDQYLWEFGQL